jgi:plastocyanin
MHVRTSLMVFAATLAMASCGGGGGGAASVSTPTAPSSNGGGGTTTTVTINILGEKGALSFKPDPATVAAGQTVIWKNTDSIVHRIVIEGVIDTGDIAPGASSAPQQLGDVSKGYHCGIHPTMVGSLNGAPTPDPGNCDPFYGC